MSDTWTIHITIDGPGASVSQSVDIPAPAVEYHGFDPVQEAGHELLDSLITDLREVDRMLDGEFQVYVR